MNQISEEKADKILEKLYYIEMRLNLMEDKLREINFEGCWLRHQKDETCDKED